MSGRKLCSVLALLLLAGCASAVTNETVERCDPAIEGFFRNLNCQKAWNYRIDLREAKLAALLLEYKDFQQANFSLSAERERNKEVVRYLQAEIRASQRRLESLRGVENDIRDTNALIDTYVKELQYTVNLSKAALELDTNCQIVTLPPERTEIEAGIAVAEDLIQSLLFSQATSELLKYGSESKQIPKKLRKVLEVAYNLQQSVGKYVGAFETANTLNEGYRSTKPTTTRVCS